MGLLLRGRWPLRGRDDGHAGCVVSAVNHTLTSFRFDNLILARFSVYFNNNRSTGFDRKWSGRTEKKCGLGQLAPLQDFLYTHKIQFRNVK